MAAWRSLDAEAAFCEQMVEHAEASSFRNRWDRDRLRVWQQREREASMRLRATRAAGMTEGLGSRVRPDASEPEGNDRAAGQRAVPSPSVISAPILAQPKNTSPAPTLFDKEAA